MLLRPRYRINLPPKSQVADADLRQVAGLVGREGTTAIGPNSVSKNDNVVRCVVYDGAHFAVARMTARPRSSPRNGWLDLGLGEPSNLLVEALRKIDSLFDRDDCIPGILRNNDIAEDEEAARA